MSEMCFDDFDYDQGYNGNLAYYEERMARNKGEFYNYKTNETPQRKEVTDDNR